MGLRELMGGLGRIGSRKLNEETAFSLCAIQMYLKFSCSIKCVWDERHALYDKAEKRYPG